MPSPGVAATWGQTDFASFVLDHLSTASVVVASGVTPIPISGREAKIPRLNTDGTATWTAEGAEINSSAPDADMITLTPKALKNVVSLGNESLDDTAVETLDRVGMALTRAVATELDKTMFDATVASAVRPAGLRSTAFTFPGAAAATIGDVASLDLFLTSQATINNAGGNARVVYMSMADNAQFASIKIATGDNRPLIPRDANGRLVYQGLTFFPVPGFPDDAAIVADPDQLLLGVRKDIDVQFSSHAKFTADSVVARVVARFDWNVNDVDGVQHLT